jgi:hypothetical protein
VGNTGLKIKTPVALTRFAAQIDLSRRSGRGDTLITTWRRIDHPNPHP